MAKGRKRAARAGEGQAMHLSGEYRREAWGCAGMTVRIYRAWKDGRLYAMRSARGVIATAETMADLADLARKERWVATYRHVTTKGEVWVTIPD